MICFLYVFSCLAFLVWSYLQGDSVWYLALINSFRYWIFAPVILFWVEQIWEGFTESKTWALGILTAIWLFLYIWFPFYENNTITNKQSVKIMTFNILYLNKNINGILNAINKTQPDIIAFQEMTAEQGSEIKKQLKTIYPYSSYTSSQEIADISTFSKFPIESIKYISVKNGYSQFAKIKINNQNILIVNIHTESIDPKDIFGNGENIVRAYREREEMINTILSELKNTSIPKENTILMGDFNSTEGNKLYSIFKTAGFKDSYREVNPIWFNGFTWPTNMLGVYKKFSNSLPFLRLDYIYAGSNFKTLKSEVFDENTGSDHKPLITSFSL